MMYNQAGYQQDTNPSCLRLQLQPAQFNSQSVPPVPQMPDIPPQLQQYIPAMGVQVGNSIARMATINPAFTYLANLVTGGRYQSPLWYQMVQFGMMVLWIKTSNNGAVTINSLIEQAAGDTVVMKASFLAATNQVVFGNLDAATQNQARELANQHEQLRNSFEGMIAQFRQQAALAANPAGYATVYGGVAGHALAQGNVAPTSNPYGNPVARTQAPGQPIIYGNGTYDTTSQLKKLTPARTVKKSNPFDLDQGIAESVSPPAPAPVAPTPAPKPETSFYGTVTAMTPEGVSTKQLAPVVPARAEDWKPIEGQFYRPAFAVDAFKLAYEKQTLSNGRTAVVATVQMKDDDEMQEAEHQIPTLNRAMRDALAARQERPAGDAVVSDLELVVRGMSSERVNEEQSVTEKLQRLGLDKDNSSDDLGEVSSMRELVTKARQRRILTGSKENVFMITGTLVEDIVSESKAAVELKQELSKCTSLMDVITRLNVAVDTYHDDADMLAMISQIVKYFTDEVNFVVQRRMGLSDLWLDDITQDVDSLVNHLKEKHGSLYSSAFVAFQAKLGQLLVGPDAVSVADIVDEEGEILGHDISLKRDVCLVLLNMESSEFGVSISNNEAHEVFSTNFPGLQQFIGSIVDHSSTAQRFVIATLDNKFYGVHRSILGDKPTIIFNA